MPKLHIDTFKGSRWEDIMKDIQDQYENFDILETDTKRQMPFFWIKEYSIKVTGEMKKGNRKKGHVLDDINDAEEDAHRETLLGYLYEDSPAVKKSPKQVEKEAMKEAEKEKELEGMKTMIETLVTKLENKEKGFLKTDHEQLLLQYYTSMMESEVEEAIARHLISEVQKELDQMDWQNHEKIETLLIDKITKNLKVTGPLDLNKVQTIALIGPTGVGKTTTLAKIAGNLRSENKRIGLISTDVYRIAAIEQLDTYANILECTMKSASSPQELREAINYFKNVERVDQILIDTVGRSPMITESIDNIKEYLEIAQPDHVSLVLSSTQKSKDMTKILNNFKPVKIDSLIFTKLDETMSYGFLVNVLSKGHLQVSYVTNGQIVPDDITIATSEELTEKVVNGVKHIGSSILST